MLKNIMPLYQWVGGNLPEMRLWKYRVGPLLKMGHFVERFTFNPLCHIFMIRERPL